MSWVAENTDAETLEALERMYERHTERRQRYCRGCETTHYASSITPAICPICDSEEVEVR